MTPSPKHHKNMAPNLPGEGFRDNETWLLGPMDLDPADWRWQEIEEGPQGGDRVGPGVWGMETQDCAGF